MKKFLLTAIFACVGSLAFSQERIAVFPFEDMDNVLTRNEAVLFYNQFSNEFATKNTGKFMVIERQAVDRLISTEASFQLSEFSAREKTSEMQRVLNGTQILSGYIAMVDSNIRITVSLFTFPDLQRLPNGATVSVPNKTELFNKIPELVQAMQGITTTTAGGGTNRTTNVSADVSNHLNMGNLFSERKDWENAVYEFGEAIRLDPNNSMAYFYRGTAYLDWGAPGFYPTEPGYENEKNPYGAIPDLDQAIKLNPNYAPAYINRGNAYDMRGDSDRAIADFNQAIRLEPNNSKAYVCRGQAYYSMGDISRFDADINQAIRLDPNNREAYATRAIKLSLNAVFGNRIQDANQAIADYTQLIRLNPNDSSAYDSRGLMYRTIGDYDRAIVDFTQAIALDPNNSTAYFNRGMVYYLRGSEAQRGTFADCAQAISDFEQVISLNPNDPNVYESLSGAYQLRAGMYELRGNATMAIIDYENALRFTPNNPFIRNQIDSLRSEAR